MVMTPPNPAPAAKKLLRYKFSLAVLFFEALGFVACCLISPCGYWGGIFLVVVGSFMGFGFQCSRCRTRVPREVTACRHCGAVLRATSAGGRAA